MLLGKWSGKKYFDQNMHWAAASRFRTCRLGSRDKNRMSGSICRNRKDNDSDGILRSAFADLEKVERQMLKYYERAAQGDEKYLEKAAECQQELEIRDYYSADTKIEQVMEGLGLSSLGGERFISEMSGGQRAKIILAKILLEEPDVLLLDEPTNFLDHEHVAWLAGYLSQIENAFLVVSHDDEFLNLVSNRIFDVDQKTITKYYGTYTEFQEKKAARQKTYECRYNAQQKRYEQQKNLYERT